jgi:hypothetical protein
MGVVPWLATHDELERHVANEISCGHDRPGREAVEDLKPKHGAASSSTHHLIVRILHFTAGEQCAAIHHGIRGWRIALAMKTRQDGGCFGVSTIQSWVSHFCQRWNTRTGQARVYIAILSPANLMLNGAVDLKDTDFGIIHRSMSDSDDRGV